MIRLVVIGGEPATGKKILVKDVVAWYDETPAKCDFKSVLPYWHLQDSKLIVVQTETKGLSENEMDIFLQFIEMLNKDYADYRVLIEGDSFFHNKLLDYLRVYTDAKFAVLYASKEVKDARHRLRDYNMSEDERYTQHKRFIGIVRRHKFIWLLKNDSDTDYKFCKAKIIGFLNYRT